MIESSENGVRPASEADLEAINKIRAQLRLTAIGLEDLSSEGRTTFVSTQSGAVIGYATVRFPASRHQLQYAEVEQLFVSCDIQRTGVGTALLQRAQRFACAETTATHLYLRVAEEFEKAQRCYIKFGFKITGREGQGVLMTKPIREHESDA
ncbi:GNAT family N-acetyltransferase [Aquabacterium humicola]|uniref:GNAT family N-acetyltransferase n=1 Tax=Aquabacterium humicola TaxID=3237377 RepID=UPI002543D797|nr:GNAT family N-acetyltransferase [Rubrivivax pictus]